MWLPSNGSADALADIRESIAFVLQDTPWKFSLWRSVVRAAARRPFEHCSRESNSAAKEWLSAQLRRVAHVCETEDPRSWMHTWPEEDAVENEHLHTRLRDLYLSFHRAAFWHALADVLRQLWSHHDRTKRPAVGDPGPPPGWWTVRAVPTGRHREVAEFLSALDQWSNVLYPPGQPPPRFEHWTWELDQLVACVLASVPRRKSADAWRRTARPAGTLVVPAELLSVLAPQTLKLLVRAGRALPHRNRARCLNASALAHLYLAGQDRRLGPLLFPKLGRPRLLGASRDPDRTIALGVALGCSGHIDRHLLQRALAGQKIRAAGTGQDHLSLLEYSRVRRLLLGHAPITS